MKNWELYQTIYKQPESLEALQNSIILPKDFITYAAALDVIETQEYKTFLLDEDFKSFRNKIDQERVFRYDLYLERCRCDKEVRDAELKRQEARNLLNLSIYKGFIKSVIFKFDSNQKLTIKPATLSKEFWGGPTSFQIDGLSMFFEQEADKFISKGVIALERASLEKWGAHYPREPNMVGRKKGSGSIDDEERLNFMHQTVLTQKISANKAAQMAVEKFGRNGGSEKNDADRLGRKYREKYPS